MHRPRWLDRSCLFMMTTMNDPRDVRMRGFQTRTPVKDVVELLDKRLQPLAGETVDIRGAAGRVLVHDVLAECPVPGFDRAAMDGYALRGDETSSAAVELAIVGQALPAMPFQGIVQSGQAVRIMT